MSRLTFCLESSNDPELSNPSRNEVNDQRLRRADPFAIRHRHFFCNLFIMSQYPRGINKVIRSNSNNILIWQMKDRTIYEAIFPEFSSLFKGNVDKFIEIMQKIDDMNNHSFLFIYYDKEQFIRLNFDQQIILD